MLVVRMDEVLKAVLKRVKPTQAERKQLERVANETVARVNLACAKLGVPARGMLVGSAARDTWLHSERDIDIFILFPEKLSREELEQDGLRVAWAAAGRRGKERFAEHPYITTHIKGFELDLVPCYDVTDPSKIKSAVDRSPHHQRYVSKRLTELTDEVLLLKKFMDGIGTYGAELKVHGFSGYLCELLVLRYRTFKGVVEAASKWVPGEVIDLVKSYHDVGEIKALFPGQPLVIIDPVDPNRNAAAAVSMQNFSTFVRACQDFVRKPSERFFFPAKARMLGPQEVKRVLRQRGTALFCLAFDSPNVVEDILYPQLRKTEQALVMRLVRAGFEVLRSDVWANSKAAILIELSSEKLPKMQRRLGPPITVEAGDFIEKHLASRKRFSGPFVDQVGRLVFEVERRHVNAKQVFEAALEERAAFGKHVAESLAKSYKIYEGKQIVKLCADKKFSKFLSEYLTRCLPWYC
jgi:tRNA nucleotidyltransferase (CCA-adding enzyme)